MRVIAIGDLTLEISRDGMIKHKCHDNKIYTISPRIGKRASKLTWKIVRAIKELFKRKTPVTNTRIAEYFGVKQPTISDIKRGVTWLGS